MIIPDRGIIFDTDGIIREFNYDLKHGLPKEDVMSVVRQVFDTISGTSSYSLNNKNDYDLLFHNLPNFSLFTSNYLGDDITNSDIIRATEILCKKIYDSLKQYGLLKNNQFDFYFDGMFGNDVILKPFPY